MPRRYLVIISLFILGFTSCGQKKETKYMYYGLTEALNEKYPSKVIRLSLLHSNLDTGPEELMKFTDLIELNLAYNNLKSIPSWLIRFKNLQRLDISVNK